MRMKEIGVLLVVGGTSTSYYYVVLLRLEDIFVQLYSDLLNYFTIYDYIVIFNNYHVLHQVS